MIGIIDYGMGNIGSVKNMLKKLNAKVIASSDIEKLNSCSKLILPGVGNFKMAMQTLSETGLGELIKLKAKSGTPILGVCLGMQLLTEHSEEGDVFGLGLIPSRTKKFEFLDQEKLKVPHMGWNKVESKSGFNHKLIKGISHVSDNFDYARFYFVHSYYVKVNDIKHSLLTTNYGFEFDSAIMNNNVFGVQFHPEKSHRFGFKLLDNFIEI